MYRAGLMAISGRQSARWARRVAAALLAMLALVLTVQPAAADRVGGAWSPLAPWPLIPIHAVLLPDGRLLTYGTTRAGQQTGRFVYDVWDPAAGLSGGHLTLDNTTQTDLFCNAQIILPRSGRVFMAGGDIWNGTKTTNLGVRDTTLFDPATNQLSQGPAMSRPRWYATLTTLLDGSTYIQGGRGDDPTQLERNADLPELREIDGRIRLLETADTRAISWNYPRNWVALDGRVVGFGDRFMYAVDPTGSGMVSGLGILPDTTRGTAASEVMFAPGRILRVGGGLRSTALAEGQIGTNQAYVVNINTYQPTVTPVAPMLMPLHWHNATVLPDGKVVVTGGSRTANQLEGVSSIAQIWDPVTNRWTAGAQTTSGKARLYHSMAILLPDASVLVGGGGAKGPQTNTNVEIWYPPYLFDANGARAPRPRIKTAPTALSVGDQFSFQVSNGADIRQVVLIKTGSVTHSFNMEQRRVPLSFTRSGNTITAKLSASPGRTPPGRWMLFVLDKNGVPSVARLLTVRANASRRVPVNWTPSLGTGFDGAPFTAACPAGTVLVGMQGRADTKLQRVQPFCVAVDGEGRWKGSVLTGDGYGSTTSGQSFTRICPRDTAVSGYRGLSGINIGALSLECRQLAAGGAVTGGVSYVDSVGWGDGTAFGPFRCGTGLPAYAIYGRTTGSVRSFGVVCRDPVP